jgi:hypothetical protein
MKIPGLAGSTTSTAGLVRPKERTHENPNRNPWTRHLLRQELHDLAYNLVPKKRGETPMTRQSLKEATEATETLRGIVSPGDILLTGLRHASRSGNVVDVFIHTTDADGKPWLRPIGSLIARAIGVPYDLKHSGLRIGGCGSDAGFEAVYYLGRTLWRDGFGCSGKGCHSNDHTNGDRDYTPHSEERPHWHSDGGYALRHKWI